MPEPFDWSLVTKAAETWMGEHDTAPKFLLLPSEASREIADMAEDIYDVPCKLSLLVEVPRFDDELPRVPSDLLHGPIMKQEWQLNNPVSTLIERAKRGELTTAEIQKMSLEEYAQVRHILLPQSHAAAKRVITTGGWKDLFKKVTDITES